MSYVVSVVIDDFKATRSFIENLLCDKGRPSKVEE